MLEEKVRIDKYLWSIRIFKTRSLATEACKNGRVKMDGNNQKASGIVKIGETYTIQKGSEKKIVKVLEIISNRVDAKKAVLCYEDLSPVVDKDIFPSMFTGPILKRDKGAGRPTKRDRRNIDKLKGE